MSVSPSSEAYPGSMCTMTGAPMRACSYVSLFEPSWEFGYTWISTRPLVRSFTRCPMRSKAWWMASLGAITCPSLIT